MELVLVELFPVEFKNGERLYKDRVVLEMCSFVRRVCVRKECGKRVW